MKKYARTLIYAAFGLIALLSGIISMIQSSLAHGTTIFICGIAFLIVALVYYFIDRKKDSDLQ